MRTFVLFITDRDIDSDNRADQSKYYKTLPGMLRNYFGNFDGTPPTTRSYGYAVLSPANLDKQNVVAIANQIEQQLPSAYTNYTIPVVIDQVNPDEKLLAAVRKLEQDMQTKDETYHFNILRVTEDNRLEAV